MTGTDLCVNKPHCAEAVRPLESEATTSTLPPARVRTCSVLSGSCSVGDTLPHTVVGVCGEFQRTGRFLQRGI